MKKKLCSIVCLCYFVSIMLCACGRKEQGNPIRLPAREDIVSIGVSDGDKYAMSPNTEGEATEFIDEFLSMLMDMETTSQQSINDALLFVLLLQMSRSELSHILNTEQENLSLPFRICDYLKNNYSHKITGSMLEDIFHHNFDYMNRRFKQHTGTTIFAFLENLRIEQGKKLLKSRQFTISETAEALGFCNAFYFSRVFKKHEAITPSEYQQKHSV